MKKSILKLVKDLQDKLLMFPTIVNSLEKKEFSFVQDLINWITHTEDILTTYRIADVSELSGLRSKILASRYADTRSISNRKLQLSIASAALYDIQHVVLEVLNPYEQKVEECRELIRQLLLIVSQAQVVSYNPNVPFDKLISDIWNFILSNEQLKAGAIKIKTLLPITDIPLLIADEINLDDFQSGRGFI